jgi:hypothetical protein
MQFLKDRNVHKAMFRAVSSDLNAPVASPSDYGFNNRPKEPLDGTELRDFAIQETREERRRRREIVEERYDCRRAILRTNALIARRHQSETSTLKSLQSCP